MPYSLQIKFYGDEKNIIKILNKGEHNKLNNSLNFENFTYTKESVVNTWDSGSVFVPIMATQRPLCIEKRQKQIILHQYRLQMEKLVLLVSK